MSKGNVGELKIQFEELLKQVKKSVNELTDAVEKFGYTKRNIESLRTKLSSIQQNIEYLERIERQLMASSSSDGDEDDDNVSSNLAVVRQKLETGRKKRTEVQNALTVEKKKKEQYEQQIRQLKQIFLIQYWAQQEKIKEEAEEHEKDLNKAVSDLPMVIVRSSSLNITGERVAQLKEKEAAATVIKKKCDTLASYLKQEGNVIDKTLSVEKEAIELGRRDAEDIANVKSILEGIPTDVDDDIVDAVSEVHDTSISEATSDMESNVKQSMDNASNVAFDASEEAQEQQGLSEQAATNFEQVSGSSEFGSSADRAADLSHQSAESFAEASDEAMESVDLAEQEYAQQMSEILS